MPVFLDDQPWDLAAPDLASLLDAAAQSLADRGRMVVEVSVDGNKLDGDLLEAAGSLALADQEVRLYSADPRDLARQTLYALQGAMEGLRQSQADAAEKLQTDAPAEAMNHLRETLEVWMQAQQAVMDAARVSGTDLDTLQVQDDQTAADTIQKLLSMLHELKDLIGSSDTVALADALAYEWPEMIDQWQAMTGSLIDQVEKPGADQPE